MASSNNLSRAGELLRRPLEVINVNRGVFGTGRSIQDEIITTNRLILILRGKLRYTIEGRSHTMSTGTQFLVPAWVRRVWGVPQGGPVEIAWCEFAEADGENGGSELARRKLTVAELRQEIASHTALQRSDRRPPSPWARLHLEAGLKVILVRFFAGADSFAGTPSAEIHPQVKCMLRWLQEHYCEPDVLEKLYAGSGLTRNYFRKHFSAATLCSPHDYIERQRLRHARYLLRSTSWQLKRIAAEVGYDDPLYFSRLYRRFWKHSPSAERAENL